MILTGRQREILKEGILGAYLQEDELKILLSEKMDLRYSAIARGEDYTSRVAYLIEILETEGKARQLIQIIVQKKPSSPYLSDVITEFNNILNPVDSTVTSLPKQSMNQTKKTGVDIGIIIALKEEFREFFKHLSNPESFKDEETGVTDYLFFPEKAQNCKCAATFVGDMGPEKAALATDRFIQRRQPKTIVMLGIAGGMSKDVKLGDVVVVKTANNYLHKGKAITDGESFTFEMGGDPYSCSNDLVRAVQDLEFAHASLFQEWQQEAKNRKDQDSLSQLEIPQFVEGAIASSSVVGASETFVKWLKQANRKYLAIEMEAAGMLTAVYSHADPKKTLILRGISDLADERKKELDAVGKGAIRRYAMNNAISLLWKLIEAGVLGNP
jgi:nucleoside phosphorylase